MGDGILYHWSVERGCAAQVSRYTRCILAAKRERDSASRNTLYLGIPVLSDYTMHHVVTNSTSKMFGTDLSIHPYRQWICPRSWGKRQRRVGMDRRKNGLGAYSIPQSCWVLEMQRGFEAPQKDRTYLGISAGAVDGVGIRGSLHRHGVGVDAARLWSQRFVGAFRLRRFRDGAKR